MDFKVCTRCHDDQPVDAFLKIVKNNKPTLSSWCRSCRTDAAREHRRAKPELYRAADKRRYAVRTKSPEYRKYQNEYQRRWRKTEKGKIEVRNNLLAKYGLTHGTYDEMFRAQRRRCAICRYKSFRRLHVDHCHDCGGVRMLLCGSCNQGLGSFRDDVERLQAAIEYLLQHQH